MKTLPLDESATVTFDANGQGTAFIGPNVYGTSWSLNRITTSCTSPPTNQVTFIVYKGFISPGTQIGGTFSGQQDSDETTLDLKCGDLLVCQWTGGNQGDSGTVSLFGTKTDIR